MTNEQLNLVINSIENRIDEIKQAMADGLYKPDSKDFNSLTTVELILKDIIIYQN